MTRFFFVLGAMLALTVACDSIFGANESSDDNGTQDSVSRYVVDGTLDTNGQADIELRRQWAIF